jgi:hypothetical protein
MGLNIKSFKNKNNPKYLALQNRVTVAEWPYHFHPGTNGQLPHWYRCGPLLSGWTFLVEL